MASRHLAAIDRPSPEPSLASQGRPSILSFSFTALAVALAMVLSSPALALDVSRCRALRDQRDALATEAMEAELTLVRQVRERICGQLTRQAELANANQPPPAAGGVEPATDYRALLHCRQRAEQVLKASHEVLYRNRLGFVFYTPTGASLASRADGVERSLLAEACPAWLRGEPEPASGTPR